MERDIEWHMPAVPLSEPERRYAVMELETLVWFGL